MLVIRTKDIGVIDKVKGIVGSVANKVKETANINNDVVLGTGKEVKESTQDATENAKGKVVELNARSSRTTMS